MLASLAPGLLRAEQPDRFAAVAPRMEEFVQKGEIAGAVTLVATKNRIIHLAAAGHDRIALPNGVPLATPGEAGARNVIFVSQWDNYPKEVTVPLSGKARGVVLLMAGSTSHMQSRFENGEVVVTYADGSAEKLELENPTNWWPIEQDYFIDDFQFRRPEPVPMRVNLKTGTVRVIDIAQFKGRGGPVPGGAATVLDLPLQSGKELKSLTVRAVANEVVIGLMSATLIR